MIKRSNSPVFIIGSMRSGTSLMRAIIGSHPEVSIPPNDCDLLKFFDENKEFKILKDKKSKDVLIAKLKSLKKLKKWNLNWDILEKIIRNKCNNYKDVYISILENYWNKTNCSIKALKRPFYEFRIEFLLDLYPNATFIYMIRNAHAVVSSRKYYNKKTPNNKFLKKYCIVASKQWKDSVNIIKTYISRYNNQICKINYEELVSFPKKIVSDKICRFIGVDYTDKMLSLEYNKKFNNKSYSNSSYRNKQVNKINNSSLNKWKKKLTNTEIKLLEYISKRELIEENYNLVNPKLNIPQSLIFYINLMAYFYIDNMKNYMYGN